MQSITLKANDTYEVDIAVIGGGASGLAAAAAAGRELGAKGRIALIDAQPRCGKKLLATGNGRCNLTNRNAIPNKYHTDSVHTLSRVFSGVNVEDTLSFLKRWDLSGVKRTKGEYIRHADRRQRCWICCV